MIEADRVKRLCSRRVARRAAWRAVDREELSKRGTTLEMGLGEVQRIGGASGVGDIWRARGGGKLMRGYGEMRICDRSHLFLFSPFRTPHLN